MSDARGNGLDKKIGAAKKGKIIQYTQDHNLYFNLGVKHAMRKNYADAMKYVEMAIEKDPYNTDYLFNKACILVELKRTRESVKLLNYIIWNIDPTFSECYFGLGCNYFELGNFDKALQYFEKYVNMEGEGSMGSDAQEILHYMRFPGDGFEISLESPIGFSEKALKRSRDSSMKLHAAGSMYLHRGNYKEAIRQFERSIMAYPETKSSRLRLSMAYYMNGQLALAKLLASSVLKIQKSNHLAKLCLALYYFTEGQADASERILSVFARVRNKKQRSRQESEDHEFYEQMLSSAPVGDELKSRLSGAVNKLYAPVKL